MEMATQQTSGQPVNNNHLQQAPVVSQTQIVVSAGPQMPNVVEGSRDWSTGMCGCMNDCSGCFAVMLCPLLYQFHLASRSAESCFIPFFPGGMVALRTKLRVQHNIRGSICDDCVQLTFCSPCTLCQMGRELNKFQV